MKQILIFLMIPVLFTAVLPGPSAAADRSPFTESPKQISLYNYTRAVQSCKVVGLITTQTRGRVILKLNDDDHTAVYREGDSFQLFYRGISHRFTLEKINPKSIRLKGGNKKVYEVEVR